MARLPGQSMTHSGEFSICFEFYKIIIVKNRVGDENQGYRLYIGSYSAYGTAGDSMTGHHPNNGMKFSTWDRDNDKLSSTHCAQKYIGGWWFSQ